MRSEYRHVTQDGRRYKETDVTAAKPGGDTKFEWRVKRRTQRKARWIADLDQEHLQPQQGWEYKGVPPYKRRFWAYSHENLAEFSAQGKLMHRSTGAPRLMQFADEMPGVPLQDLWTDIPPLSAKSTERMGWPTQKPVALLERIISASSREGDVVLDAFCGCGTTLEASVRLDRKWIGVDSSPTACRVMARRLEQRLGMEERRDFRIVDLPKTEAELRGMPPFEFQNWAVTALGGLPNRVKVADFGIDGRLYVADRTNPLSDELDLFGPRNLEWYPIQVKQKDRAGRPDIDSFVAAMHRDKRILGYFVAFDFTRGADAEIRRLQRQDGIEIVPVRVREIMAEEARTYGPEPTQLTVAQIRERSAREYHPEQGTLPLVETRSANGQSRPRVRAGRRR